ncbi:MAG: hypothetical protein ACI4S9_00335, partial [Christensenellales bacterium]
GEFAVSNVNMVITDEATGVYPTEVSEMTFNVPSINLIDSVYQGEYESFEGASDNRAVIVFATISFKDYELAELGECGLIIRWTDSDGQHEKNFVALNTAQNGNFGIALYNMPGGNYEVQGYISDGSILSNVINITVS